MPIVVREYSYAIAFYSQRTDGMPLLFQVELRRIGLKNPNGYSMKVSYISYKNIFEII